MRPKPHTGYTSLLKGSDFVFQSGFNAWPRTISLQVSTWFRLQHHDLLQPQCLRTHSKRPHLSVVKFLKSVYSVYHPACYLQTAAVTLQNHFVFLLPTTYFVFCTAFNTITSFSVICLHPHTYLILRSCFVQMLRLPIWSGTFRFRILFLEQSKRLWRIYLSMSNPFGVNTHWILFFSWKHKKLLFFAQ